MEPRLARAEGQSDNKTRKTIFLPLMTLVIESPQESCFQLQEDLPLDLCFLPNLALYKWFMSCPRALRRLINHFYNAIFGIKHKSRGRSSRSWKQNSFGDSFSRVMRGSNMLFFLLFTLTSLTSHPNNWDCQNMLNFL